MHLYRMINSNRTISSKLRSITMNRLIYLDCRVFRWIFRLGNLLLQTRPLFDHSLKIWVEIQAIKNATPHLNLRICSNFARIVSLHLCHPSFLTFDNFSLFAQSGFAVTGLQLGDPAEQPAARQEYAEAVAVTSGQTADKTLVIIPPEEDPVTKIFFGSAL
jgi:hypothetical protein